MKYYEFKGKNTKPKKRKRVIKIIILLFIIAIITSIIVLYNKNENIKGFIDTYILKKEVYEENLKSIELDYLTETDIYSYNEKIVTLNQNELNIYNKYAKKEHSMEIEISNPIFASNEEYLCIAEEQGEMIYLISEKNVVWQKKLEGNVSDIFVNKNGYVAIILTGTNYQTVVETYDTKGTELFKTFLFSTSVIDIDISNDNKYLAIAELNFSGVLIKSNVKIINIEEAQKNANNAIVYNYQATEGDLIINIKYNDKNRLICMYDNYIASMENGEEEVLITFSENSLFSDINLNSCIMQIEKKSTGLFRANALMKIIETNTKNEIEYVIDEVPKQIYTTKNVIAVNLGTEIILVNTNGWLIKKYTSSQEIESIVITNGLMGVVYKDKINVVSF